MKNLRESPLSISLLRRRGGQVGGYQKPPCEDSTDNVLRSIRGYPRKNVVSQDAVHEVPDLFARRPVPDERPGFVHQCGPFAECDRYTGRSALVPVFRIDIRTSSRPRHMERPGTPRERRVDTCPPTFRTKLPRRRSCRLPTRWGPGSVRARSAAISSNCAIRGSRASRKGFRFPRTCSWTPLSASTSSCDSNGSGKRKRWYTPPRPMFESCSSVATTPVARTAAAQLGSWIQAIEETEAGNSQKLRPPPVRM